jgi:hypothetical protein
MARRNPFLAEPDASRVGRASWPLVAQTSGPLSFAGVLMRLLPIAGSMFITFVGTKVTKGGGGLGHTLLANTFTGGLRSAALRVTPDPWFDRPCQVSTVVRIVSVFWASASALAMPAIKNLRDGGEFDTDTFLSLGGGIYAGAIGSAAAVSHRPT